jgi:hypothetical protein
MKTRNLIVRQIGSTLIVEQPIVTDGKCANTGYIVRNVDYSFEQNQDELEKAFAINNDFKDVSKLIYEHIAKNKDKKVFPFNRSDDDSVPAQLVFFLSDSERNTLRSSIAAKSTLRKIKESIKDYNFIDLYDNANEEITINVKNIAMITLTTNVK